MANSEGEGLPLFIVGAEDTPIVFSNFQVIQHLEQEFILNFCQFSPPMAIGSPEEVSEQVNRMPYLPVKVVARLGMTPRRMESLIETLQTNYNRWKASQG